MSKPADHFKSWHFDPEFWRDIYKNVLSASIIAGVGLLVGSAAGVVDPEFAVILVCSLLIGFLLAIIGHAFHRPVAHKWPVAILAVLSIVVLLVLALYAMLGD